MTATALCADLIRIRGDLWHSTSPTRREQAKTICARCPLRPDCAEASLTNPANRGVWGALDTNDRRTLLGLPRISPHPDNAEIPYTPTAPAVCGTDTAFRAHRTRGQDCEVCQAAHDARIAEQRLALLAVEHAKGGTYAGYKLHRRMGLEPCEGCRKAANAHRQAGRQRQRRAGRLAAMKAHLAAPLDDRAIA